MRLFDLHNHFMAEDGLVATRTYHVEFRRKNCLVWVMVGITVVSHRNTSVNRYITYGAQPSHWIPVECLYVAKLDTSGLPKSLIKP